MSEIKNSIVQNSVHNFRSVVQEAVQARKDAKFSQEFIAEWLGVDRRKIMSLESGKLIDFDLLCRYAEKLSMNIYLVVDKN